MSNPKHNNSTTNSNCDDVEYFPRRKRAPYLHDISDFGITRTHHHPSSLVAVDDHLNAADNMSGMGGLASSAGGSVSSSSSLSLLRSSPTKASNSSGEAGGATSQMLRRKSSFARVFSTLRMTIAEDGGGDGNTSGGAGTANNFDAHSNSGGLMISSVPTAGGGGGTLGDNGADDGGGGGGGGNPIDESSESNLNSILPTRFRRGSSADFMNYASRGSASGRDRLLGGMTSNNTATAGKIPRWALYDPATIVIKDGMPISMGTLLHHYSLLNNTQTQQQQLLHNNYTQSSPPYLITPTWRLKERMKTVGVCLILALNIGTDPPDLNKPTPCAKLQCWLDPTSMSRAKAKERIGERLEQQYAKWQQRSKLKYRRALDPTVDTVRELCYRMRETAKNERVLLHYNGHGVPRPTANGEIWLFDKHHTNYIPMSVTDLRRWIGKPSILVLDCSGAGVLMPFLTSTLNDVSNDGAQGGWDFASSTPDVRSGPVSAAVGIGSNSAGIPIYRNQSSPGMDNSDQGDSVSGADYLKAIRDTIVLCPTAQGEWLPLNAEFPADIFTSCLTTPIPMALRWFVHQNPFSTKGLNPETIADAIPGRLADRKTPLGELNWIFTAITDTIAWNVLPSPLFQRLFRQDLLVASMFRNFLLADRILRSLNCSPTSHPELPSTCHHPLWQAWDLAVEGCLNQLIDDGLLRKSSIAVTTEETNDGNANENNPTQQPISTADPTPPTAAAAAAATSITSNVMAPFFAEQLTAFEIWLEFASQKARNKLVVKSPPSSMGGTPLPFLQNGVDTNRASHELDPPQQLPIVLQVLLSQAHRVRALILLKRFLDLGNSAVNLALSVGIFPYVLKLLQSPIDEYKHVLVGIWAKVLAFDPSCQVDVVKDRALPHFIRHLRCGLDSVDGQSSNMSTELASEQRTLAAFILSITCSGYPIGQSECINEKLHLACGSLLQSLESPDSNERKEAEKNVSSQFRLWLCICLGNLCKDNANVQSELFKAGLHFRLLSRLDDDAPDVRAASCYALACLIGSARPDTNSDATPLPGPPPMLQHQQQQPQSLAPSLQPLAGGTTLLMANLSQNQGLQQAGLQPQFGGSVSGMPNAGAGQSLMFGSMLSSSSSAQQPQRQETKTVYDDGQRMDLDLTIALKLAETSKDASPMVRFEAALALNRFVGKYIAAFVSTAGKGFGGQQQGRSVMGDSTMPSIPVPTGVTQEAEKKFSHVWTQIFKLNRNDPHDGVRAMVNSIVIAVNERAMMQKTKLRQLRSGSRRRSIGLEIPISENDNDPPTSLAGRRTTTGLNLSTYNASSQESFRRTDSLGNRASSGNGFSIGTPPTVALAENASWKSNSLFNVSMDVDDEYFFPESKIFSWKRVEFGEFGADSKTSEPPLDPLSEMGAIKKYRRSRNYQAQQKGQLLKNSFAVLAQKPAMSFSRSPYDYDESDAAAGIEKETDIKKQALQLQQFSLLKNDGARSTSLLRFHPYEPALVVCGSSDNVSIWNAETSERMTSFSNENPKGTRMTAAQWVNEATSSLLLTGSNDGSVRIFDGLLEANDEISREKPSLVSSFFAAPDIVTDKRYSSGLVLDYQQYGGKLTAGGNTKYIRTWDVASEKCVNTFESKSDACLTTLTTAWDYSFDSGYSGLGPDIIVCGYGNGSLRVFDGRSTKGDVLYLSDGLSSRSGLSRRRKYSEYDEHTSWIVDVSFTTYGGRHEVVSGCVAGNIKFWDLRYSSSVRTIDHKMQMTALAAHSNVPMFATGSPAQFIKIMSHDGSTQQVIRYHDRLPGQRIGPVSCLCFHPQLPFLAAGFADENVSLYAPKQSRVV